MPTIGGATRNAASLNLNISADLLCECLAVILRQTIAKLFDSLPAGPFTHFHAVFSYILQPTGSS